MRNHKYYVFFVISFLFIISCKSDKIKINGKIEGILPEKVYLTEYNLHIEKLIDSAEVNKDGSYQFTIQNYEPNLYRLIYGKYGFIWLLPSKGEKINLQVTIKENSFSYTVAGSVYSQQISELNDKLYDTRKKLDSLEKAYVLAILKGLKNQTDTISLLYDSIQKAQRKYSINFVIQNLSSPASIFAIYQRYNDSVYVFNKTTDLQFVKLAADTLIKYFPNSNFVKSFYNERNRLLTHYNQILKQNIIFSSPKRQIRAFPEIKLLSLNGDSISLSKITDNLTLLTFWIPIDRDCQLAMNTFTILYNKYHHKGLKVYHVALFNDIGYWSNIIKKLNIPGIHVIDEQALNSVYASIYNVQQVPSTYLLNKDGIIASNVFGDKLENEIVKYLR